LREVIEVKNVTKKFGKISALSNVSFTFKKGILGLIGPNGSGKTTLIKILMGFIKPTIGCSFVLGFNSWKESSKIAKLVGYMPENLSYPKHVSCVDYLSFVAKAKNVSGVNEEVKFWLKFVNLYEHADRCISKLSMGMRRRFALACALIGHPELLILDEPTANLDINGRAIMLEKLKELHGAFGINILLSSHILYELERVCDTVAIMSNGMLIEYGKLADLYEKHGLTTKKFVIKSAESDLIDKLKKLSFIDKIEVMKNDTVIVVTNDREGFFEWISKSRFKKLLDTIHESSYGGNLELLIKKVLET